MLTVTIKQKVINCGCTNDVELSINTFAGLSHAHIAIKMQHEPRTAEEIDGIIQAELPADDPELLEIVKAHMLHTCYPERCFKDQTGPNFKCECSH